MSVSGGVALYTTRTADGSGKKSRRLMSSEHTAVPQGDRLESGDREVDQVGTSGTGRVGVGVTTSTVSECVIN
jgi:hypothetical protein